MRLAVLALVSASSLARASVVPDPPEAPFDDPWPHVAFAKDLATRFLPEPALVWIVAAPDQSGWGCAPWAWSYSFFAADALATVTVNRTGDACDAWSRTLRLEAGDDFFIEFFGTLDDVTAPASVATAWRSFSEALSDAPFTLRAVSIAWLLVVEPEPRVALTYYFETAVCDGSDTARVVVDAATGQVLGEESEVPTCDP